MTAPVTNVDSLINLPTKIAELLQTGDDAKLTHSETWPLLLKDLEEMHVMSTKYTPTPFGYTPESRPIDIYMQYGVINLDKPCNPSSHEVVSWVKSIFKCERTGHSGTLDPMVSGCLPICLNRATRIAKAQQNAGKEYVAVVHFDEGISKEQFQEVLKQYVGPQLQRPPEQCAVKRNLRIRTVTKIEYLDFDAKKQLGMFRVACEAGTYIRSLCVHLGLHLGVKSEMVDLRRTKSGIVTEDNLVTMHDVLDSYYLYSQKRDERYLRSVVKPLESLLVNYPRIIIKDSTINALCYGAQLTTKGILRYDNFNHQDLVVLVSPKGEAIALAVALVTAPQLSMMEHGQVTRTKRVIMDKDTYPRQWKLGPGNHPQEEEETKTDDNTAPASSSEKEADKQSEKPADKYSSFTRSHSNRPHQNKSFKSSKPSRPNRYTN
ncbi:H/ACA ribonucleoprotein complex subunit 4 [Nematocida homosporus]|uniref:H/ACA ribonucleoprotein complex subunit 4 n=1 Tax=Nematocida homosporus TaxID=1912981 RepID=UPI0022203640|nr:H/ACA ribonucleoprotein complex subunit 4 [Nematocida homosporus]KAI5185234.1 H/ACA ribonucleoprotein complex subunit 4 [Nematocida homosporus]